MTKSEHEKERRAFWDACCIAAPTVFSNGVLPDSTMQEAAWCADIADKKLDERDKRFPAPESGEK